MNGYLVAAGLAGAICSFLWGVSVGEDHATAASAREKQIAQLATAAAAEAAASAIASITVTHRTVNQTLEREVRENTVFRDCRTGPVSVRAFNSAIPAEPGASAAAGLVPAADAAH